MLSAERSFQSCVPGQRAILEPGGIKVGRGKKRPRLARMFPIQNFKSEIHIVGCTFECRWLVIYTLGIDPALFRGVFFTDQKRGDQSSLLSQRTRNRGQP